jgi:hypothetical protein
MQRIALFVGAALMLFVAGCTYERRETVAQPAPAAVAVPPATIVTIP